MNIALTRRAFLLATGVVAGGMGAGCGLQRAALQTRTYVLQPPRPEAPATGESAGVLTVRPFRVAPVFDSRAFVVRRGESEYTTDAYHSFLLSPGPMLTEAVAEWIRGLGVFMSVNTGGSQVPATHVLEGEAMELNADYRVAERPGAVLALRFRLLQPSAGSASPVQWQFEERRVIDLPRPDADELVAGWNRALAEICRTLDSGRFQRPSARSGPQG